MIVILLFGLNAALSFALSLVLAALLGPPGFGVYALALASASFINAALFEWLRLATTRFTSGRAGREDAAVPATLRRAYAATSLALAGSTLLALGVAQRGGRDLGVSASLIVATALAGLALGWFDRGTALARARFRDGAYAILVGTRGVAAFALATAAAFLLGDPAAALAASALAAAMALGLARRGPTAAPADGRPSAALLRRFARYAWPLVAAGAVYQLLPVLNRAVLASRSGLAEAGYFSLASEIGLRLFQNLGAALDLALFQLAVRAEELHGPVAAERQAARNLGIVVAVVTPAAAGLVAVLPSFEAVFVPAAFSGQVVPAMTLLVPAFACFAIAQFGLSPLFQLRGRTAPAVAASLVALALDTALVFGWPGMGSREAAAAQLVAVAAALATLTGLAVVQGGRLPWRDIAGTVLATLVMLAVVWPLRQLGASTSTLAVQVAAGAVVYAGTAFALDLAGCRAVKPVRRRQPK